MPPGLTREPARRGRAGRSEPRAAVTRARVPERAPAAALARGTARGSARASSSRVSSARRASRRSRRKRCARTGTKSRSTSSGTAKLAPIDERRTRARRARARGCRGPRRPTSRLVQLARRADELDDPALEERVDVDVLDAPRSSAASSSSATRPGASRSSGWPWTCVLDDPRAPRRRSGYPSEVRTRKRSSWASGSGKVPSCSIGFSVAIRGTGRAAAASRRRR